MRRGCIKMQILLQPLRFIGTYKMRRALRMRNFHDITKTE